MSKTSERLLKKMTEDTTIFLAACQENAASPVTALLLQKLNGTIGESVKHIQTIDAKQAELPV